MKTNAQRSQEWKAKNPVRAKAISAKYRNSEKGRAATKRGNNKQAAEAIRARAIDIFSAGGIATESRNMEILDLYRRGKTPADIVIRLHVPMSRVMAVIQNT